MTTRHESEGWADLPAGIRAQLLLEGVSHPGETPEEARHRLKRALDVLDDDDLSALTGASLDTLARHRVNGTGPRPVRILRSVFYLREDVQRWIAQNRDATGVEPKAAQSAPSVTVAQTSKARSLRHGKGAVA